jgi:hypothetical protein
MSAIIDRTGEKAVNQQGLEMTIISYKSNKNITVRFTETGAQRQTSYYKFKRGKVKDLAYLPQDIEEEEEQEPTKKSFYQKLVAFLRDLFTGQQ